jgi:serine/threonine protein kinase
MSASQDVWALGVMAYEAIVQVSPTLCTMEDVFECAHGHRPYPWELPTAEQPRVWRTSRLRALVAPCLSRDPTARPTSAALLGTITRVGQVTNLAGTHTPGQ